MAILTRAWRWWKGRSWILILLLLVGMVIFRLGWGLLVERQIKHKLAELRGRGEPVDFDDVSYPPLPDAQNAFKIQFKAALALNPSVDPPRSSNLEYGPPPYPPVWKTMAAASEKAHGQVFALARAARAYPTAQFHKQLVPQWPGSLGYLNTSKMLTNTLADGAEYAHFTGDDQEAVERFLDLMHLARSLRQDDFFPSQLVAIGVEALTCYSIQNVAPELLEKGGATSRPASVEQIRQLMDALLDERMAQEGIQRSLHIERLLRADAFRKRMAGAWWVRPVGEREMLRTMVDFEVVAEAARCENYEDAFAVLLRDESGRGMCRAIRGGLKRVMFSRTNFWSGNFESSPRGG